MSHPHNIPFPVLNTNGQPSHVLVPLERYLAMTGHSEATPPEGYVFVPPEVALLVDDEASPLRAWREYLKFTQEEVALRMGITRSAYTQMEHSGKPHRFTLERAAKAFGIELEQILELYDDEPVTTPQGKVMV